MTAIKNARPALVTRNPGQDVKQPISYANARQIQAESIRTAVEALRVYPDQVMEVRAIDVPAKYGKPFVASGYFDDYEKLVHCALDLDARHAVGIYVTLNPVTPQLLGRAYTRIVERPQSSTADNVILQRVWLPFDVDPVRPAGVTAMPCQVEAAKKRTVELIDWLQEQLDRQPDYQAFSGNGFHVLCRLDLPNNEKTTEQVKNLIDKAADEFDDNVVQIDRTVFNASRIWKLCGTTARKGDEVPRLGMLHRRAELLSMEALRND
jgi:hypothetical protein